MSPSIIKVDPPAMLSHRANLPFDKCNKSSSSVSSQLVWVPHATQAFCLGQVEDIRADTIKVRVLDTKQVHDFPYSQVFASEPRSTGALMLPEDNCALMFLNPATLLENTRLRYARDAIYTYVANILIAVNPYKTIDRLYVKDSMHSYQNQSLQTRPPHVFAIGDKAYREMRQIRMNQSIIVSGESGSGKTESVKYILKYLTECYGQQAGIIEERILDSNPLLEAFGNAKTTKNNNSSRFGKFIELHFQRRRQPGTKNIMFDISGGYISHYLLERSRICIQPLNERNYHIFYQLCARADSDLFAELALDTPDKFTILSKGKCTSYFTSPKSSIPIDKSRLSGQHLKNGPLYDIQLDDGLSFDEVIQGMKHIGLKDDRIKEVLALVAAILHLGNICFVEDNEEKASSGGCIVDPESERRTNALSHAARLLGIAKNDLRQGLMHRTMVTKHNRRDSFILVPLNVSSARHSRDGLCKMLYVKLFDYMVSAVNKSIPVGKIDEQSTSATNNNLYIGILDIAGFEYMPVNSFEQFCINYCNEKLQQFFNSRILRDEQALYEHEGLGVAKIEYVDNQDCIDLIEARRTGILSLLDEESRLPSPDFEHFTREVFNKNKNHNRLDLARKSPLKLYREILDTEGFMIRHFAGAVVYSTSEFIDKNNDAIHTSLVDTLTASRGLSNLESSKLNCSRLLAEMLPTNDGNDDQVGKLNFLSVGSKFKSQLSDLLDRLQTTGTSFVRCIKPNELMKPAIFDGPHILSQLQCAGMLSVLELMQQGFPSRAKFDDLYSKYKTVLPSDLAKLEPRFFCKALFHSLNMSDRDFRFGLTRVFFRSGKFAEFDAIMTGDEDDPECRERMKRLVERARKWIGRARWRKVQYTVLSVVIFTKRIAYRKRMIIALQSIVRQWLIDRTFRPVILALCRIRAIETRAKSCLAELGGGKSDEIADRLMRDCESILGRCEVFRKRELGEGEAGKVCGADFGLIGVELCSMESKLEKLVVDSSRWAEEFKQRQKEQKLKALQRELEEENRKRELAEREKQDLEREAQQRALIEQRRLQEAEKVAKARIRERETKKQLIDSGTQAMFQDQQNRLDLDLATKLAAVTGSAVDPLSIIGLSASANNGRSSSSGSSSNCRSSKFDLSSWKYAQLRDAINTSCDIELLEACREEFHRRLKAYHLWKAKNRARGAPVERRIPVEMAEAIEGMRAVIGGEVAMDGEQRYFKVGPRSSTGSSGVWYAHFDGRWVCRQLQLGGRRTNRPLVAGVDDVDMCELSLDETDLITTPGVEITETEFERVWAEHGGDDYVKEHYSQVSSKWLQERYRPFVSLVDL